LEVEAVKGVLLFLKRSSCRLFLYSYGTDDETNVAFLAAVRGGNILTVVSPELTLALVRGVRGEE
jgi:hypothetical protein